MAKKKTQTRKKTRQSSTSRGSTRRKVTKKKASAKKSASKKKTASRKAASKKKPASKKKATAKKVTSKKKASAKKVTSKKKATAKKKAPAKKATSKKSSAKTSSKGASAKTMKSGGDAEGGVTRRRRRQTVAEAVLASDTDSRGFVIVNGRRIRRIAAEPLKKTRKRSSASTEAAKAKKDADAKPVKTKLGKPELEHFRLLLITKRRELLAAVDSMEYEALRSDDGDTSSMPIHMADVGSDVYEQDLKLGMAASERERIRDIDEALQRIVDGTYGVCALTKKSISKKRLNAKPWAKYTIDSARKIERGL